MLVVSEVYFAGLALLTQHLVNRFVERLGGVRFCDTGFLHLALRTEIVSVASVDEVGPEESRDLNQLPHSDRRDLARLSSFSSVFIEISDARRTFFRHKTSLNGVGGTSIVVALGTFGVGGGRFPVSAEEFWGIDTIFHPNDGIGVVDEVNIAIVQREVFLDCRPCKGVFVPNGQNLACKAYWERNFTPSIGQHAVAFDVSPVVWPVLRLPDGLEPPRGEVPHSVEPVSGGQIPVQTAHLECGVQNFTERDGTH